MELTLRASAHDLCYEVVQATSYAGAKSTDDTSFARVAATQSDAPQLVAMMSQQFTEAVSALRRVVVAHTCADGEFALTLRLSPAFDTRLEQPMQLAFADMLVQGAMSRWYAITGHPDGDGCRQCAARRLAELVCHAFFKKRPQRPNYL